MDAAICDNYIAVSTYSDSQFMIHILRVNDPANSAIAFVQSFFVADAEVNCLSLSLFNDQTVELLAGLWQGTRPLVARARIGGDRLDDLEKFDPYSCEFASVHLRIYLRCYGLALTYNSFIAACRPNRQLAHRPGTHRQHRFVCAC